MLECKKIGISQFFGKVKHFFEFDWISKNLLLIRYQNNLIKI